MPSTLQVAEGISEQTALEEVVYTLDVANGPGTGNPSAPSVKVIDTTDGTDVTSTVMDPNTPTVSGTIITLSKLTSLTIGRLYHVRVKYTRDGNIFEPNGPVKCIY